MHFGGTCRPLAGGAPVGVEPIHHALECNEALAEHWNQQLFLSAVRASLRAPMYFTAVTQGTEQVSY
jgi:hypothetical protein